MKAGGEGAGPYPEPVATSTCLRQPQAVGTHQCQQRTEPEITLRGIPHAGTQQTLP